MRRPLASWITWLASVRHKAGSTPQPVAAAWTSIARVPAPALRSGVQNARMELELPVTCWWKIGLPYRASFAGACSKPTCDQSASISSARIMEIEV